MFEVGKNYEIHIVEVPGEHSFVRGTVLAFEGTLLKLQVESKERIFNTAAPSFVDATEYSVSSGSKYQPMTPPSGTPG